MQEGGTAAITPEHLSSEDEDSPPEEVIYSIRTPINGKVVLKPSPTTSVQRFTQAQINSQLVQFIHEGMQQKEGKPARWMGKLGHGDIGSSLIPHQTVGLS